MEDEKDSIQAICCITMMIIRLALFLRKRNHRKKTKIIIQSTPL